jgi:nucleoside permease NupC
MAIAYLLSHKRSAIHWKTAAWGLGLWWIFSLLGLKGHSFWASLPLLSFQSGREG